MDNFETNFEDREPDEVRLDVVVKQRLHDGKPGFYYIEVLSRLSPSNEKGGSVKTGMLAELLSQENVLWDQALPTDDNAYQIIIDREPNDPEVKKILEKSKDQAEKIKRALESNQKRLLELANEFQETLEEIISLINPGFVDVRFREKFEKKNRRLVDYYSRIRELEIKKQELAKEALALVEKNI